MNFIYDFKNVAGALVKVLISFFILLLAYFVKRKTILINATAKIVMKISHFDIVLLFYHFKTLSICKTKLKLLYNIENVFNIQDKFLDDKMLHNSFKRNEGSVLIFQIALKIFLSLFSLLTIYISVTIHPKSYVFMAKDGLLLNIP